MTICSQNPSKTTLLTTQKKELMIRSWGLEYKGIKRNNQQKLLARQRTPKILSDSIIFQLPPLKFSGMNTYNNQAPSEIIYYSCVLVVSTTLISYLSTEATLFVRHIILTLFIVLLKEIK